MYVFSGATSYAQLVACWMVAAAPNQLRTHHHRFQPPTATQPPFAGRVRPGRPASLQKRVGRVDPGRPGSDPRVGTTGPKAWSPAATLHPPSHPKPPSTLRRRHPPTTQAGPTCSVNWEPAALLHIPAGASEARRSAPLRGPPWSRRDVVAAAGGAIAAPAGSARASRLAFTNGTSAPLGAAGVAPQPLLGRTVGGLSADALARVRAAVAAAGEGASPVEVARIASATLRAVMEDVPTHVDELPARGEEPVCDYGDF